jgi:CRP/FNR family transcriptional regulator, anaerobic regulatory protein
MQKSEHKLLEYKQLSKPSVIELLTVWKKEKQIKPKEHLINFHQTDSNLYFIKSGFVRLYVIDNHGNEKNIGFGYENTFITSFQSFITEKPSLIRLQAILETEVQIISKKSISDLITTNKEISNWYQSMIENTLAGHIQRQIELLTLSPQERYTVFQKRSGHLINSIPLKHIASYLMMTPETLSRIRANIS